MNKITITVTGVAGSGKSAISQHIMEQLNLLGITTGVKFINDEHDLRSPLKQFQCLESIISSGVKVDIVERQSSVRNKDMLKRTNK